MSAREKTHQSRRASLMLTCATSLSARDYCSDKIGKAGSHFCKRKVDSLISSAEKHFWSAYKEIFNEFCNSNFSLFINPDGSIACSPTGKANFFGSRFC